MPSPFDALGAALLRVWGEACTLSPLVGPPRTIRAIFRDTPEVVEVAGGKLANVRVISLRVRKSDAQGLATGATVTVASRPGQTFAVRSAVEDGTPGDTFVVCRLEVSQ